MILLHNSCFAGENRVGKKVWPVSTENALGVLYTLSRWDVCSQKPSHILSCHVVHTVKLGSLL